MSVNLLLPWKQSGVDATAVLDADGNVRCYLQSAVAAEIVRRVNAHDALVAAMKAIAKIGGTMSNDFLMTRTGPNDAAHRGIMYANAREIANAAIKLAEGATE